MKTFKGSLETTDGNRSSAALTIDPETLTIEVGDEHLGSWAFDSVSVRRTASDRFALDLHDERVIFIANDPIDFAYTVPGWVETHQPKRRRGLGRHLRARKAGLIERIEQSGGRRRTRKLAKSAEHLHTWKEQALAGGLIRRICMECGHVSIDLRDTEPVDEVLPEPQARSATG